MINDLLNGLAQVYGIAALKFEIPMRRVNRIPLIPFLGYVSSNDPEVPTTCSVSEERYKLSENYKITLKADEPMFSHEHFYCSDLELLMRRSPERYRMRVLMYDDAGTNDITH
jgi:hypothetical protein